MKKLIVFLLCYCPLNAQTIFSTDKIEGSKINVYTEYFLIRTIDSVYTISDNQSFLSFVTKSGSVYNYLKANLIGWEDVSKKAEVKK
jgi:hypothetical protein